MGMLLLLQLSHFSHVRLCATPQTAAHQGPPSLGLSRQEHWSGLPFPSPMQESESEVAQSCLTLHDPMDCSPPGSPIHGIFQARVLEWGAIARVQFGKFTVLPLYARTDLKISSKPHQALKQGNVPPLGVAELEMKPLTGSRMKPHGTWTRLSACTQGQLNPSSG